LLIKQFRSSYHLQYFVLVVLAAALWIRPVIDPCGLGEAGSVSPLFSLLAGLIPEGGLLVSILAFAILLIEAFYLNYVLIKHELVAKNTLITAFIYIIVMSQSLQVLTLNPALCAALFVIPALDLLLGTYGKSDPTGSVFNAAFLLGIASLFHFAFVFLVLVLLLSMIVFGTFSIRIFLVSMAGLFTVYLYLFLYYFLVDETGGQADVYLNWFITLPEMNLNFSIYQYVVWIMQDLLFLLAFFIVINRMGEWSINIRKIMLLCTYYALIALASYIFITDNIRMGGLVTAIPFSIFIATYLSSRKKISFLLELYFFAWYVFTFINNIYFSEC